MVGSDAMIGFPSEGAVVEYLLGSQVASFSKG